MDKGLTPEGADWLYNSSEALSMFPGNVYDNRPERRKENAIVAAMRVNNPRFEDIACRLLEQFKETPETFTAKRVKKTIEVCRTLLNTPEAKQLSLIQLMDRIQNGLN